jgi:hypothetical protein
MWRQTEGMLERAPEVKTGELRDLRKTLQRDYLVEVRLDELSEFLLLPACKATERRALSSIIMIFFRLTAWAAYLGASDRPMPCGTRSASALHYFKGGGEPASGKASPIDAEGPGEVNH